MSHESGRNAECACYESCVKLTGLAIHPIKSCGRIDVERATIGPYGLVGDREWQLMDADGKFVTQRKHPKLATVRPQLTDDGIVVDGLAIARPASLDATASTYTGDVQAGDAGDEAAEWFTRFLGEPMRLVGITAGFERRFPPLFGEQQVAFADVAPMLVVNEASHRFLADRAVELFGVERWRANVVIDAGEAWVEDTWRSLRVGAAEIAVQHPWPRCAVPQVDQATGERHREPALVLKQHRWCTELPGADPIVQTICVGSPLFGMTASGAPIGAELAVGDEVEVLVTGSALLPM